MWVTWSGAGTVCINTDNLVAINIRTRNESRYDIEFIVDIGFRYTWVMPTLELALWAVGEVKSGITAGTKVLYIT